MDPYPDSSTYLGTGHLWNETTTSRGRCSAHQWKATNARRTTSQSHRTANFIDCTPGDTGTAVIPADSNMAGSVAVVEVGAEGQGTSRIVTGS